MPSMDLLHWHVLCAVVDIIYHGARKGKSADVTNVFLYKVPRQHYCSGGNFDGPEATGDYLEASLMVRRHQKIIFCKTDGAEAICDCSEATLMVWRQPI